MILKDLHNCNMNSKTQPPSYPLRITPEMRERLENAAKENGRSLNAEIVQRLEESFARQASPELHRIERLLVQRLEMEILRDNFSLSMENSKNDEQRKMLENKIERYGWMIESMDRELNKYKNLPENDRELIHRLVDIDDGVYIQKTPKK